MRMQRIVNMHGGSVHARIGSSLAGLLQVELLGPMGMFSPDLSRLCCILPLDTCWTAASRWFGTIQVNANAHACHCINDVICVLFLSCQIRVVKPWL